MMSAERVVEGGVAGAGGEGGEGMLSGEDEDDAFEDMLANDEFRLQSRRTSVQEC